MLLVITVVVIVVGVVSLGIGFLQSSLPAIYLSIVCSVIAAVLLVVFNRMSARSQQVVASEDGPAPLEVDEGLVTTSGLAVDAESTSGGDFRPAATASAGGSEVDFPIDDYDDLKVAAILPLLADLDLDELDLVREREEETKNRTTVLARIDQLIDQLEAEDVTSTTTGVPVVSVADLPEDDADEEDDDDYFPILDYDDLKVGEIMPLLPELDDDELEMVRDRENEGAKRSTILNRIEALLTEGDEEPTAAFQTPRPSAAGEPEEDEEEEYFPILDYDELLVEEIMPVLPDLEDDELEMVRERELAGANRSTILDEVAELLGEEPLPEVAFAAPVKKAAAAKKTPPVKRSAPAKKAAPATKRSSPARKSAPAKRTAPTRRSTTTKKAAPTRKSTTAKKAAPAKRSAPTRKAAPAGKAAPARRPAPAVSKAAPPAKAAAKKASASKSPTKRSAATKAPAAKKTARRA